jgi:hypothetical protein
MHRRLHPKFATMSSLAKQRLRGTAPLLALTALWLLSLASGFWFEHVLA